MQRGGCDEREEHMAVSKALLGAKGFKAFIERAGGRYISSRNEGRIFAGRDAAAAVRSEGFQVEPWVGPRDPGCSDAAWRWHVARAAERATTFIALSPVGELAV
jgi:hypothetical protein